MKLSYCTTAKRQTSSGGRWEYAVKESPDGSETCKGSYVAKGYGEVEGIDYEETFPPTPNRTSVEALMQVAVQEDLTLHQMDVKTAYPHTISANSASDPPTGSWIVKRMKI